MDLTIKEYNKLLKDIVTKCKAEGKDVYTLVKDPLSKWDIDPEDIINGKEYDNADKLVAQMSLDAFEGEKLDAWYYENVRQDCPWFYAYDAYRDIESEAEGFDDAGILGKMAELYFGKRMPYSEVCKELELSPVPEIPDFCKIKYKNNTYTE